MRTIVVNKYFANITTYSVGLREQFWELVFYTSIMFLIISVGKQMRIAFTTEHALYSKNGMLSNILQFAVHFLGYYYNTDRILKSCL